MTPFLSEDLVFLEILTKLPAKSLMRFKCVSKTWMTRISGDLSFIDAHRRRQISEDNSCAIFLYNKYIDDGKDEDKKDGIRELGPETVKVFSEQFSKESEVDISDLAAENGPIIIEGSCEGLLCLTFKKFRERVMMWNPATRQRRLLPCPPDSGDLRWMAFGLDDVSGNWKVVHLCLDNPSEDDLGDDGSSENGLSNDDTSEDDSGDDGSSDYNWSDDALSVRAHVFAKSGTVWRDCGISGIKGSLDEEVNMVMAAGAVHCEFSTGGTYCRHILSFDLNSEVLRVGNGPDCKYFKICKWRSSLAAITFDVEDDYKIVSVDLRVASPSSCGGDLSWSKLVKFPPHEIFWSAYLWRGKIVSWCFEQEAVLSLLDPKAPDERRNVKQLRFDWDHELGLGGSLQIHDYVQTIFPVF